MSNLNEIVELLDGVETVPSTWLEDSGKPTATEHIGGRAEKMVARVIAMTGSITGDRSVTVNTPNAPLGDWKTLRDLTMNGGSGRREMPPGRYGTISLASNCILALGKPHAPEQLYQFESLVLRDTCKIEMNGPVILRVRKSVRINAHAVVGNADHPKWLTFESVNGLTINDEGRLYGSVRVSQSNVGVKKQLEPAVDARCDKPVVNEAELLEIPLVDEPPPTEKGTFGRNETHDLIVPSTERVSAHARPEIEPPSQIAPPLNVAARRDTISNGEKAAFGRFPHGFDRTKPSFLAKLGKASLLGCLIVGGIFATASPPINTQTADQYETHVKPSGIYCGHDGRPIAGPAFGQSD